MKQEYTFSMIKPDGVKRNITGLVNGYIEKEGLKIVAQRMTFLSKEIAEEFYSEHSARPFFSGLIKQITSGPVVLQVLKGHNAIAKNRAVMGATNPKDAENGTIRKELAISIDENTVHGSDSPESAAREVAFFFSKMEIVE